MTFLLDTNVVSEWTKPRPDPGVVAWLQETDEDRVFISVITVAALRHGIERLAASARRDRLARWLTDELPVRFADRLLPIDVGTANVWGRIMAQGQAAGRTPSTMDAFIAAAALRHGMTLVTRNVADFEPLEVPLLNPWRNA